MSTTGGDSSGGKATEVRLICNPVTLNSVFTLVITKTDIFFSGFPTFFHFKFKMKDINL